MDTVNEAGLSNDDVKLPGPLHVYVLALVAVPLSVRVLPAHNAADDKEALTPVGATVQPRSIVTVATWPLTDALQPAADVAVVSE